MPKYKDLDKISERLLSNSLQKQFENIKIQIPNPDRLENYREEKFIREKSDIAREAENLNRQISN